MKMLTLWTSIVLFSFSLSAGTMQFSFEKIQEDTGEKHTVYFPVPKPFEKGERVENLLAALDVDGTLRASITEDIAAHIKTTLHKMLVDPQCKTLILSGSVLLPSQGVYDDFKPLMELFWTPYALSIQNQQLSVRGMHGAQWINPDGTIGQIPDMVADQRALMLKAIYLSFLQELPDQKRLMQEWQLNKGNPELEKRTREVIDPKMKINALPTMIELHFFRTDLFDVHKVEKNLRGFLKTDLAFLGQDGLVGGGVAKKDGVDFAFLNVSLTHKGVELKTMRKKYNEMQTLIFAIGDTTIDAPMYETADLAFHVGTKSSFSSDAKNTVLFVQPNGKDHSSIDGTALILKNIYAGIGKSFYTIPYIPVPRTATEWEYWSVDQILKYTKQASLNTLARSS